MSPFERYRTAYAEAFFQKLVMVAYFGMLAPVWGSILLWYLFASRTDEVLNFLGFTIVASVAASWWFSRYTAYYMVVELQSFKLAFQNTFYPFIMKLTFLPIIGGCFAKLLGPKKKNPFREPFE